MNSRRLTRTALAEQLPGFGVLVLESHHGPEFEMEWRVHDFVKVVYVLSGSGRFCIGRDAYAFAERDVIVVPPGKRNRIIDDPGTHPVLYIFCLAKRLLDFDPALLAQFRGGPLRRSSHLAQRVERLLRRLLFEQAREGATTPLAMVAAALQFVQLVVDQPVKDRRAAGDDAGARAVREEMQSYIRHLDRHFYEATDIDDAARRVGISRRQFTQLFRELTGTTWLQYVRNRSLEHAVELLRETKLPIAGIAFECGFQDLSTFYRRFKTRYGRAPGEWRGEMERGG